MVWQGDTSMEIDYDIIVIGGGIAGITAAQYAARENLKTLVIEELAAGGQALLVHELEDYPGYADPVSGIDFAMRMERQARNFGVDFEIASVTEIKKSGETFQIKTDKGEHACRGAVIATGSKHKKLGIQGETEFTGKGVSYCGSCDGPFFKNRKILVIGGGDKACEEAEYLAKLTDKLTIVHRGDSFSGQRALGTRLMMNQRANILFSTECREIRGTDRVRSVLIENTLTNDTSELQIDGVFIFVGSEPRSELLPDVKKNSEGYIITDGSLCTSVPGLYAAGDVREMQFRTMVAGSADGAVAGHNLARYILEKERKPKK